MSYCFHQIYTNSIQITVCGCVNYLYNNHTIIYQLFIKVILQLSHDFCLLISEFVFVLFARLQNE